METKTEKKTKILDARINILDFFAYTLASHEDCGIEAEVNADKYRTDTFTCNIDARQANTAREWHGQETLEHIVQNTLICMVKEMLMDEYSNLMQTLAKMNIGFHIENTGDIRTKATKAIDKLEELHGDSNGNGHIYLPSNGGEIISTFIPLAYSPHMESYHDPHKDIHIIGHYKGHGVYVINNCGLGNDFVIVTDNYKKCILHVRKDSLKFECRNNEDGSISGEISFDHVFVPDEDAFKHVVMLQDKKED